MKLTLLAVLRLAQILYGENEDACTVDAKLLYDLSTPEVTLAARCQKTYLDGGWQWALNTLATFPEGAAPGQPYALKKVAFHDEPSCGRYRQAAEKLSTQEVAVTSACRPTTQPNGKVWSVLETSVALR